MHHFPLLSAFLLTASVGLVTGCEEKKPAAPATQTDASSGTKTSDAHGHADGDKHDHDHADGDKHDHDDHGHGDAVDLGTVTIAGFAVKVAQEGSIAEGKEAAFDVTISGGSGKPNAVRAWIGTEDAKGSVKAKAEAEGDGYHLHAEAPKPLPAGAKLWIEIEAANGQKSVGSLALKG